MQTIPNILGVFFRMILIGSKNNSALNFLHEKKRGAELGEIWQI